MTIDITAVGPRTWVTVTRRVLAGLFALSWLTVPGFGIPDLLVTWDPDWYQVLEAGWGLFMGVLVAVPFIVLAAAPRFSDIAQGQLLVAVAALAVAAVATADWRLGIVIALLAGEVFIASGLPRLPALTRPRRAGPLLAVAVVAAPAWIAYAVSLWPRELQRLIDADYTMDIDHLGVQGALAVALPSLAVLAAFWPRGRMFTGLSAGVCAFYLGLVSWAWPETPTALPPAWSVACAAWGLAVAVLAPVLRPRGRSRRGTARPRPHERGSSAPAM
ncbi:hypothetical protein [Microbacterium candidum]|uniref:DUF998 domain-containing protein n=1 Tax=Microbacterium candidum TaxID=3041922 RepID=A0ABT7MZB4_9MICO|nr:hypothetical protein [Microbacterium sp. ASV49]MDL9979777.1 hypothetical protein [Microbacterium sp. ASV49]